MTNVDLNLFMLSTYVGLTGGRLKEMDHYLIRIIFLFSISLPLYLRV